jgi:hypothetical protein
MSNIFNIDAKRGKFNKTQVAILRTLKAGRPLSMRELEEKLEIKRLTLLYNLQQLGALELVHQDRSGKIYTWTLKHTERGERSLAIPIEQAYDLLAKSDSQKLWGIQGGEAVRALIEKIGEGTSFKSIHQRQRLRQVIVDAILTVRGVESIKSAPHEELVSHLHRPTILHVVPDTPELDNLESITDGKVLLLIDRERGEASQLREPRAIAAYLALHETIKALATKVRPQEVYGEIE